MTVTTATLNIPLALNVLHLVEDHSEDGLWRQSAWASPPEEVAVAFLPPVAEAKPMCGTAGCLAGWVGFSDGYTSLGKVAPNGFPSLVLVNPDTGVALSTEVRSTDEMRSVRDHARDRLGLTDQQADSLFESGNSLNDLRTIIGDLIDNARREAVA